MKTLVLNRNVVVSIFAVILLLYGVQGISYAQDAPDTIVEFADANLARAVRKALGLPTGDGVDLLKIPKAELEKLTTLSAGRYGITDLTGLEHATQLKKLNLERNNIIDITPLAQLTQLMELNLNGDWKSNNISDITPLAQLMQLRALDLGYNNITDVTPLAQLTQLTELDLKHNDISDLTPLAHLRHLESIDAGLNYFGSTNRFHGSASEIPLIKVTSSQLLVEATLNGSSVTLTLLRDGTSYDVSTDSIRSALTVSGIDGVSVSDITRVNDTEIKVVLGFTGNFDTPTTLTFAIEAEAILGFKSRALTGKIEVYPGGGAATISASTPYPLTEATLNGSVVTLKLTGEDYSFRHLSRGQYVKVSGIKGITIAREWETSYRQSNVVRKVSDTEITIELRFSGSIDKDATLIFTVEPDAINPIVSYNGPPLTAEILVSATTEVEPTGELVVSIPFPLTKATLDDSIVVLTLQNRSYAYKADEDYDDLNYDDFRYVGISGVHDVQTAASNRKGDVIRLSSSEILVRIDFQGDFDTDVTLTFTVPPSIIENYDGPPLTAKLSVTVETELRVLIPELQEQPMFWVNTQTGKIGSSEYFDAITNEVTVLTVDRADGKLYWGERSKDGGIIKRADFNGTNVEALVTLSSIPRGIVVDAVTNKMYWTNSDSQIQTATLHGEDISTIIQLEEDILEETKKSCSSRNTFFFFFLPIWQTGGGCSTKTVRINLTSPTDIAVNTVDGRLYWTEFSGRIRRVNLDGTGLGTLLPEIGSPYGIVVADDKIYWAEEIDEYSGKVQRANLNGTNIETLATVQGLPTGISVDTEADKVYWANSLGGIQRTDINGGEVEVVVSGITAPGDFVLVPSAQPTTPATATTDATVNISPASVASPAAGEQLELSLKIKGGKAVAGYQATVQFDDTAFRYVSSENGDFLPAGAFFVEPKVEGNFVKINAASLAGETNGDGTLASLTFEVIAVNASILTLSDVLLTNSAGEAFVPTVENAEITEAIQLIGDINGDGIINIQDLVLTASNLGKTGQNPADVNGDGSVNIQDLVLVAGALGNSAAAPSLHPQSLEMLTVTEIKQWLSAAQHLDLTDTTSQRGILFLQQLLITLTPKETTLLPNFPNPFNPETWIPYHLAKEADVTLHIYAVNGTLVRTLALGHQPAGIYQSRSRAAYWDGRNAFGEPVASGVYFYTLSTESTRDSVTAGNFTATRKMLIRK